MILLRLFAFVVACKAQDLSTLPNGQSNTPGVLLPPMSPPGAYDSLVYAQLIKVVNCPGVENRSGKAFNFLWD